MPVSRKKRKELLSEETKVGESFSEVINSRKGARKRRKVKSSEESLRIDCAKKKQKDEALMEEISRTRKGEEIHAARGR